MISHLRSYHNSFDLISVERCPQRYSIFHDKEKSTNIPSLHRNHITSQHDISTLILNTLGYKVNVKPKYPPRQLKILIWDIRNNANNILHMVFCLFSFSVMLCSNPPRMTSHHTKVSIINYMYLLNTKHTFEEGQPLHPCPPT